MANKIDKDKLYSIKNEIMMAESLNKEELEPLLSEAIERYTGKHVPEIGFNWDIVLNEVYPVIQNNLPSIFFRNPRVFLKPRNKTFIKKERDPISGRMVEIQADSQKSARTQESILNYLLSEIKYKNETRKVLLDSLLFPHGVLWHGYKGEFGMTEEQSIFIKKESIFVKRVSPLRFIFDPAVTISNIDEARWVGRIIDVPLIDIIEDDKLDVDKTKLKGFIGFGDRIGTKSAKSLKDSKLSGVDSYNLGSYLKPMLDYAGKDYKNSIHARFVKVYEIFLRPTKKEKRDGKKGNILLLTFEQEKPLRVNDWTVKAEGFPVKVLEFNGLNDAMFGMADIDTYKQIADQKNSMVNIQLRNAEQHTKTWIGISKEGANEEDIERVQKGDNTIVTFDSGNPRDRMFVASPGGASSSELYLIDQRIQRNLEDKSMVTDLKRGFLQSGEESAESVKQRMAGGSARPAYRQDIMSDFLKSSLLYLNQLTKQFLPFKDAVRIMGTLDIEWSDKPTIEELQADVDVDLDVISMLPENPQQELQQLNMTLSLMIQGLTIPQVAEKLRQEGKTVNLSPIIEQILLRQRINNPDVFRNIRPEESQGYVSVQQIREAKENVNSALHGQPVQYPPTMNDDHVAKLEVYTTISKLLEEAGQVSDTLNQLIQMHQAILSELQKKETKVGQPVKLDKGGIK